MAKVNSWEPPNLAGFGNGLPAWSTRLLSTRNAPPTFTSVSDGNRPADVSGTHFSRDRIPLVDSTSRRPEATVRGDVPLTELRFRCSRCGTDRTDFVVTSRDNPQPW